MENKNALTKFLAIAGTVLVLLPILAPLFFGVASLIGDGRFRFDYLMPAELFFVTLGGWVLLIWAAIRARSRLKIIGWSAGIAVAMLFIGQGLAMVTGLASGANEATGWRWVLVLGSIIVFELAVVASGVGGILLCRDVFQPSGPPAVNG